MQLDSNLKVMAVFLGCIYHSVNPFSWQKFSYLQSEESEALCEDFKDVFSCQSLLLKAEKSLG